MAVLTWKNVDVPSVGASAGVAAAGNAWDKSLSGISDLIGVQINKQKQQNSAAVLQKIAGISDPTEAQRLLGTIDYNQVTPEVAEIALSYPRQAQQLLAAQQNYAINNNQETRAKTLFDQSQEKYIQARDDELLQRQAEGLGRQATVLAGTDPAKAEAMIRDSLSKNPALTKYFDINNLGDYTTKPYEANQARIGTKEADINLQTLRKRYASPEDAAVDIQQRTDLSDTAKAAMISRLGSDEVKAAWNATDSQANIPGVIVPEWSGPLTTDQTDSNRRVNDREINVNNLNTILEQTAAEANQEKSANPNVILRTKEKAIDDALSVGSDKKDPTALNLELNSGEVIKKLTGFSGSSEDALKALNELKGRTGITDTKRLVAALAAGQETKGYIPINPLDGIWENKSDFNIDRAVELLAKADSPESQTRYRAAEQLLDNASKSVDRFSTDFEKKKTILSRIDPQDPEYNQAMSDYKKAAIALNGSVENLNNVTQSVREARYKEYPDSDPRFVGKRQQNQDNQPDVNNIIKRTLTPDPVMQSRVHKNTVNPNKITVEDIMNRWKR